MRNSKSIDARTLRRTITRVADAVRLLGPGDHPVFNLDKVSGEAYLPDVNLFSGSRWLLPSMKVSFEVLAYAYESYAEQKLGAVPSCGKVVEQTLKMADVRGCTGVFDRYVDPLSWYTPAVRLVAYASQIPGATLETCYSERRFAVEFDGARFEVSPVGVYSNIAQAIVPAVHPANDIEDGLIWLPEKRTESKILVALDEMLPARGKELRVIAAAFEQRLLNPTQFVSNLSGCTRKIYNESDRLRRVEAAERAVQALYEDHDNVIQRLYGELVPKLYTSREFLRHFGSVSAGRNRKLRQRTKDEWAERLRNRAISQY